MHTFNVDLRFYIQTTEKLHQTIGSAEGTLLLNASKWIFLFNNEFIIKIIIQSKKYGELIMSIIIKS